MATRLAVGIATIAVILAALLAVVWHICRVPEPGPLVTLWRAHEAGDTTYVVPTHKVDPALVQ
jgi:hypothetical protein